MKKFMPGLFLEKESNREISVYIMTHLNFYRG